MTFHSLNLRLDSPAALAAWLSTQPRPLWGVLGSTYHNTFIPDESQWRGAASMTSMARYYEDLGWSSGPHLFLAAGTAHDGIWVMTSPTQPGTHAGACNAKRFGLEVVGNFAERPMTRAQLVLLSEAAAALHDWAGLGPDIVAHRDCMPGRTCPGDAGYAQKADIQGLLAFAVERPPHTIYTQDSAIMGTTDVSALLVAERLVKAKQLYTPAEIRSFVVTYYRLCTNVGLNPLLAIAQMVHETGWLTSWWCDRPRRNAAGVGVNGRTRSASDPHPLPRELWHLDSAAMLWRHGVAFRTWTEDSIPAHVGRVLRYALKPGTETPVQQALIDRALAYRTLPETYYGIAPTLRGLEGTWAVPGTTYADKIAAIANRIGGA